MIRPSPFFLRPILLAALVSALGLGAARATEYGHVVIASTTDLHGRIYPIDYSNDFPYEGGLAKISTVLQQLRTDDPHLLLVDSGDTIEGNPLAYYHARRNNAPVDPMMMVMNYLHYDSMALGNHDFNYGLAVQGKARGEAHFPWISANIYSTATHQPAYTPYIVKVVNGIRIGILGLTTPGIPYWDAPENYRGLEFHEPLLEAPQWVAKLRNEEHVDAVVITMHMGLEQTLATGGVAVGAVPHENEAMAIARGVPGVDLILMGHTHQEQPDIVINGVLLAQAGRWGDHVIKADLYFSREGPGPWQLTAKSTRSLRMQGITPDPKVLAMAKPYHDETEAWLSRPVGTCDQNLDARSVFRDSAMLDLVQRVQLEAGHADVSLASIFNPRAQIHAGQVTVREMAGLYVYDNTLLVIQTTGRHLKEALEHSAHFFLPYDASKSLNQLVDPQFYLYNFDNAAGVSYEMDVRRPYGDRIQHLTFHGQPLQPDQPLRLAMNNYRQSGGGAYTMFKGDPVVFRSSIQIRDLMIDWVEQHHAIPTTPVDNWRIVSGGASAQPAGYTERESNN
jgi:2',3'-cyclic-nucleotide 2'-phosphodiesterase / 3'-nucleotidase